MKRLFRSKKDRMIAGVCGGLADYFQVDPVLIRALFAVAGFMGGMGLLLYILLAIITPEEGDTHQSDSVSGEINSGSATIEEPPLHLPNMTEDRRWIFGVVLVGIGAILFLSALPGVIPWWGWNFLWPVVIIVLGLSIFIHYRNDGKK